MCMCMCVCVKCKLELKLLQLTHSVLISHSNSNSSSRLGDVTCHSRRTCVDVTDFPTLAILIGRATTATTGSNNVRNDG